MSGTATSRDGLHGSPVHDAVHWAEITRTRMTIVSLHTRAGEAMFAAAQSGLHFAEMPYENVPIDLMVTFGDQLKARGFTVSYPTGQTAYGTRIKLIRIEWQV